MEKYLIIFLILLSPKSKAEEKYFIQFTSFIAYFSETDCNDENETTTCYFVEKQHVERAKLQSEKIEKTNLPKYIKIESTQKYYFFRTYKWI